MVNDEKPSGPSDDFHDGANGHLALADEEIGADSNARIVVPQMHVEIPVQMHVEAISNARTNTRSVPQSTESIDLDAAFNYETQLWRLETYKDKKNERTIVKRVVRFVQKRTGYNVGEITPELAEALSRRPGKGRTKQARAEAERSRLLAESLAKRLRRTKRGRRSNARTGGNLGWQSGNHADTRGSGILSELPDFSQHERSTYLQ